MGVFAATALKARASGDRGLLHRSPNRHDHRSMRHAVIRTCAGLGLVASTAQADAGSPDPLPPLAIALRDTFDLFGVPAGTDPGTAVLNKLQLSATMCVNQLGLPGWIVHA